jgi:hypothetical protein
MIDFFSNDDLRAILDAVNNKQDLGANALLNRHIAKSENRQPSAPEIPVSQTVVENEAPLDDRSAEEKKEEENSEDLYSVDNFTV